MSYIRWCSNCQKTVVCNVKPDFCAWCGKELSQEPFLVFKNYEDILMQIEELKKNSIKKHIKQLSLF